MFDIEVPALFRGRVQVLAPTAFTLAAGSMTGIVGPNGAGKSTLLRAVAGISQDSVAVRRRGSRSIVAPSVSFHRPSPSPRPSA